MGKVLFAWFWQIGSFVVQIHLLCMYLCLYSSNDTPWLFEAALQEACWGQATPWQRLHLGRRWTACFYHHCHQVTDNLNDDLVASTWAREVPPPKLFRKLPPNPLLPKLPNPPLLKLPNPPLLLNLRELRKLPLLLLRNPWQLERKSLKCPLLKII